MVYSVYSHPGRNEERSKETCSAFSSAIRLLKQCFPPNWNFPRKPMPRDRKNWSPCQPEKELVCQEEMSHSPDNFPDYLAWETRAGSVMGQWPRPEWDRLFIYNSCLLFKHKLWDWQDGSVGKGCLSLSWGFDLNLILEPIWRLIQLDFWLPTCYVACVALLHD